MKNGYDENKGYGKSDENKCATNYSIITNNNWNDTHNSSQSTTSTPMTTLTSTIAWCKSCVERARRAHISTPGDVVSHLMAQALSSHVVISMSSMARSL